MHSSPDSVYFGLRPSETLTNTLTSTSVITNNLSLNFDLRHYWSRVNYNPGEIHPLCPAIFNFDKKYNLWIGRL